MEAMVPMMDVRACGRPDSYGQIFDDKKGFTLDGYRLNIIEWEKPLNSHLDIVMFYHRKWNSFKSKTIDLTELTDEKKYDAFRKEIQAMKIGILFNCAGNGLKPRF